METEELKIKLPSWAWKKGRITVFAGYELVAELTHTIEGWKLKVKTGRCKTKLGIACGLCCKLAKCPDLKDGLCNASSIPFRCLSSISQGVKECTEEFEESDYDA